MNRADCYDEDGNSDVNKALVEILLDRYKVKYNSTDINAITKRKGNQIGLFYQKLSRLENSMPISTITNTIRIDNDQLVCDTFSINISDFDETLWLVD